MKTFTIVDGKSYLGTLVQEYSLRPMYPDLPYISYLSAHLGGNEWIYASVWSESKDDAPTAASLREALADEIRRRKLT